MPPAYDPNNVFARILRGELPGERVFEDADTLALMGLHMLSDGHTLVISKSPARNLLDASPAQLAACLRTVQIISHAVKTAFTADGIMVQQNNETASGQDVFHLHFHVIPRHTGIPLRTGRAPADPAAIAACAARIRAALR
jgi:histidine triad (HIT) family protein